MIATAVETLSVPTGALNREETHTKLLIAVHYTNFICENRNTSPGYTLILPSRVATQEQPNNRQRETREFSKGEKIG